MAILHAKAFRLKRFFNFVTNLHKTIVKELHFHNEIYMHIDVICWFIKSRSEFHHSQQS